MLFSDPSLSEINQITTLSVVTSVSGIVSSVVSSVVTSVDGIVSSVNYYGRSCVVEKIYKLC